MKETRKKKSEKRCVLDFERETSGYMRKWEGTSLSGERTKKGEDEKMQGIFRKQQVDEVGSVCEKEE